MTISRTFVGGLLGLFWFLGAWAQDTTILATSAPLNMPQAIAVDTVGNAYIAIKADPNMSGGALLKMSPDGTVTTLFTTTGYGITSVAIAPGGAVYFNTGDFYTPGGGVFRITPDGIPALFIAASNPAGNGALIVDSAGNLYVASNTNGTIYKVTPNGSLSDFASSGQVSGMAFDASGNLYLVVGGGSLEEFSPSGTQLTTPSLFSNATGIAPGPNGSFYIGRQGDIPGRDPGKLYRYTPGTGISLFDSTHFVLPQALAADGNGDLLVVDSASNSLSRVTPDGAVKIISDGHFGYPAATAYDRNGNLFVANSGANTITKVAPDGTATTFVDGTHGLAGPWGLTIDAAGNLYVSNQWNSKINKITPDGVVGTFVSQGLGAPIGLAIDAAGTLYVADWQQNAIDKVAPDTTITTFVGAQDGLTGADGLAFDANGNLYVSDGVSAIDRVTPQGQVSQFANFSRGVMNPRALAFDRAGTLYTSDLDQGILAIAPDGTPSAFMAGTPSAMTLDPSGHLILVFDAANTIERVMIAPSVLATSILPSSRTVQTGTPATYFATALNSSGNDLTGCSVEKPITADFPYQYAWDFQMTDPTTNALMGTANEPVTIPAHGAQSFLLSLSAMGGELSGAAPVFVCTGMTAAAVVPGVNTIDFTATSEPAADVIALAATASNDGILHLSSGAGAFAVATDNAGSADTLTVSADTGAATLPAAIALCQTAATGQCLAPAASAVTVDFAAGATPTFSVFADANASIPFAPGTARIFLRFKDASGTGHGTTSVAVTTQ